MNEKDTAPTDADVKRFTFLSPMLNSALVEMREFAKKKQDGIVSGTKIKILNRLLADIKAIVKQEQSASYLELLSEEELPQNSDAVLILGQYRAAFDSFEHRNTTMIAYKRTWLTKEWLEENPQYDAGYEDDEAQ